MNLLRRALTRQPPPSNTTNELPSNVTSSACSPNPSFDDFLHLGNPPPPSSSCTSLTNRNPDLVVYHHLAKPLVDEVEAGPSGRGAKIYQVSGSTRHWMMTDAEILEDKSHREQSARMERILCPQPNPGLSSSKPQPLNDARRSRRVSRKVIPFERPISKALPRLPSFEDGEESFVFVAASPDESISTSDEDNDFVFVPSLPRTSFHVPYNPPSDEDNDSLVFLPPSSPSSSRRTSPTSRNSTRASHNPRLTFTPPSDIDEEDEDEELEEDNNFVLIPLPAQPSLPPPRNRDSIVASYYFGAHMSLDDSTFMSPPVLPTQKRPHSHPHLSRIRNRWRSR